MTHEELRYNTLRAIALNGYRNIEVLTMRVAANFELTHKQITDMFPSNELSFEDRIFLALGYCIDHGLVALSPKGQYKVSIGGLALLQEEDAREQLTSGALVAH